MSEEASETSRTGGWAGHRTRGSERVRLGQDEAKRQGRIVSLAFTLLGGRDAAMAFLNTTNSALKARPIDLAMQSELGFLRVETLIRKLGGHAASA